MAGLRIGALGNHAAAALVGFVCAYSLYAVLAPERWIPRETLVLFVADWCPKSLELQRQVDEDPRLARHILMVDPDPGAAPTRERCEPIVQAVFESAPWLRFEDEAWVCRRVHRHAAALYREHFVGLPAWLDGGAPVERAQERAVLERHGITLCPGPHLYAEPVDCSESPMKAPPVETVAVERGRDIGL